MYNIPTPNSSPLVSVCCITYNHAKFIRECLDGILAQKTTFPLEIIIHDDCSTDGSTEIIKEYTDRHPDIIKPVFENENQYSKGVSGIFANFCFPRAKGKYIAMCEGDDYWTDPLKLQKQVDFLESHPDYVMCSHNCSWLTEKGLIDSPIAYTGDYEQNYLIERGEWPMQTLSILYRATAIDLAEFNKYPYRYDVVLFWYLLRYAKGYSMPDNMAVYRIHHSGMWSSLDSLKKWDFDYKIRLSLLNIEKSENTCNLLLNTIKRHSLGRTILLREKASELWKILTSSIKYKGILYTANYILRFLLKD